MTECPTCHAEVDSGLLFCDTCGAPIPPAQAAASPTQASESASPAQVGAMTRTDEPAPPAHAIDGDPDPGPGVIPPAAAETTAAAPAPKPMRGRRLTWLARVGLIATLIVSLANIVFAFMDIFSGGGFGDIVDYFRDLGDLLPIIASSMLGQIFIGLLAGVMCFFKRAWLHPLVFILPLIAAQIARGVPGEDFVWKDTVWSSPSDLQHFSTSGQIWFWLPSIMICTLAIYWIGWKLGKPKPAGPAQPEPAQPEAAQAEPTTLS